MRLFKKQKAGDVNSLPEIDTLVIIGNGFDAWQGLNTSYASFRKYYQTHREEIMKRFHIKMKEIEEYYQGKLVQKIRISDVEIVYGDPFQPQELDLAFWHRFEDSLSKIDAEALNLYFGKEKHDLKEMRKCIRNAKRILTEAFCDWIQSQPIEKKQGMVNGKPFRFGEHCAFINFNYTDTLGKRFDVDEKKVIHIHGEASDRKSIIVGHSTHPQEPEYMLYQLGGRFRGLYLVDELLYETDKHVEDNIQYLCADLALRGILNTKIKNIYVLGHSFGIADVLYFDFMKRATSVTDPDEEEQAEHEEERDPLDELAARLEYTIQTVGYNREGTTDLDEYREAIIRRQQQEQSARNTHFENAFRKLLKRFPREDGEIIQLTDRTEDAVWHISYYSDQDKKRIDAVMKMLGVKTFNLYPSIDECLLTMCEE